MKRKRDGLLYCPDDVGEVDRVTIAEAQAAAAARNRNDDREVARLETVRPDAPDVIYGDNLVAWYRSDSVTRSQGQLSVVADKTGNGNDLTSSGSPVYTPTGDASMNYTPSIALDGTDDYAQKASGFSLGASDFTVYLLTKVNDWNDTDGVRLISMWEGPNGDDNFSLLRLLQSPKRWDFYTANDPEYVTVSSTTSVDDANPHLLRMHVDSTNNVLGLGIDGATPTTATWTGTNPTLKKFVLGSGFTQSIFSAQTFKECFVVNAISTSAQDAKVFAYIRDLYAMTIAGVAGAGQAVRHYTTGAAAGL